MLVWFAAAAVLLVATCLAPLSRSRVWWIRGLVFPYPQLAVAAALVVALGLWWLDLARPASQAVLGASVAALGTLTWRVLPYTRLHPVEVPAAAAAADPGRVLRMVVANVWTPNRRCEALVELVRRHRPDLLLTLESDDRWQARLQVLADDYPHILACPLDNLYGMHLFSRLELREPRVEFLIEPDVPSMHARVRLRGGAEVELHCLHPAPPSPTENEESTERDAELRLIAERVAAADRPAVVAGDLNDVPWSRSIRRLRRRGGLRDPRVGRGLVGTFHARLPGVRWPLDHVLASRHFGLGSLRRLPPFGSDHFALLVELVLEP